VVNIDPSKRISSFGNEHLDKPQTPLIARERRSGLDITGWLVRIHIAPSRSGAAFILVVVMVTALTCTFLYLNWTLSFSSKAPTRVQMDAAMKNTMGDRANSTLRIN